MTKTTFFGVKKVLFFGGGEVFFGPKKCFWGGLKRTSCGQKSAFGGEKPAYLGKKVFLEQKSSANNELVTKTFHFLQKKFLTRGIAHLTKSFFQCIKAPMPSTDPITSIAAS